MKEFALKHPFITFLIADAALCSVGNMFNNAYRFILAVKGKTGTAAAINKEEDEDEPAGDIQ